MELSHSQWTHNMYVPMSDYMTSEIFGWDLIEMSITTANGFDNNPKKTYVIRVKEIVEVYEFGESMLLTYKRSRKIRYDLFIAAYFYFDCSLQFFSLLSLIFELEYQFESLCVHDKYKIHFVCQSNFFHIIHMQKEPTSRASSTTTKH